MCQIILKSIHICISYGRQIRMHTCMHARMDRRTYNELSLRQQCLGHRKQTRRKYDNETQPMSANAKPNSMLRHSYTTHKSLPPPNSGEQSLTYFSRLTGYQQVLDTMLWTPVYQHHFLDTFYFHLIKL